MGQLGFQELLVIFIIALLVFGPKKLPELGKSLGKGLREFKRATNELKSTFDEQVRDADKEFKDLEKDLKTDLDAADQPPKDAKPSKDAKPETDAKEAFYSSQSPSPSIKEPEKELEKQPESQA